jgi:hypothetical protein
MSKMFLVKGLFQQIPGIFIVQATDTHADIMAKIRPAVSLPPGLAFSLEYEVQVSTPGGLQAVKAQCQSDQDGFHEILLHENVLAMSTIVIRPASGNVGKLPKNKRKHAARHHQMTCTEALMTNLKEATGIVSTCVCERVAALLCDYTALYLFDM